MEEDDNPAAVPGTRRGDDIARREAQEGFLGDLSDGFQSTALYGVGRKAIQEGTAIAREKAGGETFAETLDRGVLPAAGRALDTVGGAALGLIGMSPEKANYDKNEKYDTLTRGIPQEFHDEIMGHDNYEAASRARNRILSDIKRGQRMGLQNGGQLAQLAGGLFDVDAPLVAFSGGAYGAAKVARAALRASQMSRLGTRAALRVSGAAQGVNAGLQAGAVVGAVDAYTRETVEWTDIANMALQSMLLGGSIGGAVKGDVRTSVKAAQTEFIERVAKDDPVLSDKLDVDTMEPANLRDYQKPAADDSVGAASVATAEKVDRPVLEDPYSSVTPTNQQWIDMARDWRHDSGWKDAKDAAADEWWAKVAQHPVANMTTNNFNSLYKSESAVANFIAGNVFESANGLGRGNATAAVRMENYQRRIIGQLGQTLMGSQMEWAKRTGNTWNATGYGISNAGKEAFYREVMLEMNDQLYGRPSKRDPEIQRAAKEFNRAGDEAVVVGKGREGETPIDGFENIEARAGWTPYRWNGARIMRPIDSGVTTRQNIVDAVATGYHRAGMSPDRKDASLVADAVISRALANEIELDTSVFTLLTGDGKDFLRESLIRRGVKEAEADAIIERIKGNQAERGQEGFTKHRNDIDMSTPIKTTDGSTLQIVDLFDPDMHATWQRYARQVSGSAGLARIGITNRAQRADIIEAMRTEQRALGEVPMDADLAQAMFSHFNAGPVHGYAAGTKNEGIGHAALAKRIANLGLLEKLGVTQLAETGVIIAQNGLGNWMKRGPMAIFDRELKARNQELLDDISFITGEIGKDHWHFAEHLDLDDVGKKDGWEWLSKVHRATANMQFVQGFTSAFNHVRGFQQRTTALGLTDKVMRTLRDGTDDKWRARFEADLGLTPEYLQGIEQLIDNGTIEFHPDGFVNRVNFDRWDPELAEVFGSAISRNMNQLVQKSMAGEQDAWMNTHAGSIMMHLKTFPLQAVQKQVIRNARHHDTQALATVLYGMATAAIAVMVRDVLDGRERSTEEIAKAAFSYSNMTGFIPTLVDPMMSLIGLDDARINPYGPHASIIPPAISQAEKLYRAPGAVANTLAGTDDWYDEQAIKALPFAGTYVLSNLFE